MSGRDDRRRSDPRRSGSAVPEASTRRTPHTVAFRNSVYEISYDVDRRPLGFELRLDDFDTGFEPGTEQATHYESKVSLTDKSAGIKDQPYLIYMNHPLDYRGYTFYQSSFIRESDPHTGQFTGEFQSVFQVASNPGRPVIYLGCVLVVVGTFLQFYMRAGIFTDGGKRERERAAAKEGECCRRGRRALTGRRRSSRRARAGITANSIAIHAKCDQSRGR